MTRDPDKRTTGFAALMLSPVGLLYGAFLLAPVGFFLSLSLATYSARQLYTGPATLQNYTRLLSDGFYRGIILDTFRIAVIVTLASLLLGYALAYVLSRAKPALRGLLLFLVIAPLMTGVIVRTYGWIVLLGADGLVNALIVKLGLSAQPLQLLNREGTVIVALVHIMLPYMTFPIFSALVAQDPHLEPAAATLGAGPIRAFMEVTLPLSVTGIVMGSALVFTLTAGAVVTPALLGGRDVKMMGQQIYELIMSTFNWPLGAAVAALLVACQFLVIALYFRRMAREH